MLTGVVMEPFLFSCLLLDRDLLLPRLHRCFSHPCEEDDDLPFSSLSELLTCCVRRREAAFSYCVDFRCFPSPLRLTLSELILFPSCEAVFSVSLLGDCRG